MGIVEKGELRRARDGVDEAGWKARHRGKELPGNACIHRMLKGMDIKVINAPKGMRRNTENTTSWNKKHRSIVWQVEWMREGKKRELYRAMGNQPIGAVWKLFCEEERHLAMSLDEQKEEKKRKRAAETKSRAAKKRKLELESELDLTTISTIQNPETGAWNRTPALSTPPNISPQESAEREPKDYDFRLYLHRPLTPASFPKVLTLIEPSKPLTELLRKCDVLEFPTIYVFENHTAHPPPGFMLERAYLAATGQTDDDSSDPGMSDATGEEDSESDTSSSDSSSSSDGEDGALVEDGEIVEVAMERKLFGRRRKPVGTRSKLIEEIV